MDNLKIVFGGVVGGILVLIGSLFFGPSDSVTPTQVAPLGAQLANVTSITNPFQFDRTVTNSYPYATTTNGAATLAAADFIGYDVVLLSPVITGSTALTLPASSTVSTWLPLAGDHAHVCFVNATTSATAFYTFVGGTGTTLTVASSSATALGAKTIYGQKMGCFDFVRASATATTFDIVGAFVSFL